MTAADMKVITDAIVRLFADIAFMGIGGSVLGGLMLLITNKYYKEKL